MLFSAIFLDCPLGEETTTLIIVRCLQALLGNQDADGCTARSQDFLF